MTGIAPQIRGASPDDFEALQNIERAAGAQFADVGMPEIANDEPFSSDELRDYYERGHAWVLADESGAPIGYAVVDEIDRAAHIEQVSVHPDHQGHGYGRVLLDAIAVWAQMQGLAALTLTTFRDVPWNGPYYERYGFRVLQLSELTPGLAAVRARETADGLDPDLRICMRLDLPTGARR